ncbi:Glutaredoxin-2 [Mactra antiquata]
MGNAQPNMTGPEAEFVKTEIENNCVVIFSKTSCPHCHSTKQLFKNLEVNAKVYELDRREDGAGLQDYLGALTGARTVPRVFINGKCVGGNSEVQSYNRSGKLTQMLQECGNN